MATDSSNAPRQHQLTVTVNDADYHELSSIIRKKTSRWVRYNPADERIATLAGRILHEALIERREHGDMMNRLAGSNPIISDDDCIDLP